MPTWSTYMPHNNLRQKEFAARVKRYMSKGASEEKARHVTRRNMLRKWR